MKWSPGSIICGSSGEAGLPFCRLMPGNGRVLIPITAYHGESPFFPRCPLVSIMPHVLCFIQGQRQLFLGVGDPGPGLASPSGFFCCPTVRTCTWRKREEVTRYTDVVCWTRTGPFWTLNGPREALPRPEWGLPKVTRPYGGFQDQRALWAEGNRPGLSGEVEALCRPAAALARVGQRISRNRDYM